MGSITTWKRVTFLSVLLYRNNRRESQRCNNTVLDIVEYLIGFIFPSEFCSAFIRHYTSKATFSKLRRTTEKAASSLYVSGLDNTFPKPSEL